MTLNRKIVVLLFAGITLYTLVGFIFHQLLILPSFLDLEEDEARKDMRRCLEALQSQLDAVDTTCVDWASNDEIYQALHSTVAHDFASRFTPEKLLDINIDFLYVFRPDGTLAWGRYYDTATGEPAAFGDFTGEGSPPAHLLNHVSRASVVRGVMRSSRGPLLIVSRPIFPPTPEVRETSRGTLLMGQVLDRRGINAIRERTQVAVDILDMEREERPAVALDLDPGEIRAVADSDAILRLLTNVRDIGGENALLFQITVPRVIFARGQSTIRLNMLAAAIAGFLFLGMLLLSLKWVVTDPLHRLRTYVRRVGLSDGADGPVEMAGRQDEIGDVAREFNQMLERLQEEESELVAAEAALRRSERRIKTIFDTAPDALLIMDSTTRIESANQAASTLFGYGPEEFSGMMATELLSESCRDTWRRSLGSFSESGAIFTSEVEPEGRRRDGTTFPIHPGVSSIELDGEPFFICAIRDISGLKAMQEKVARNQHLARIGEMGATVAHEIRNPLAGIKGALQILSTTQVTADERNETMADVQELVDRIAHTVDQLLRYSRPITPKRIAVPLRPLIESVAASPPTDAQLTVACDNDLTVAVDPALFRQVLENIWRNAVRALEPGGTLAWCAGKNGDAVTVALSNDGEPVRATDMAHLFEPFYTTRVDGSGLGLAVSHRIIEAHGGTMSLDNIAESGVRVTVRIPVGE